MANYWVSLFRGDSVHEEEVSPRYMVDSDHFSFAFTRKEIVGGWKVWPTPYGGNPIFAQILASVAYSPGDKVVIHNLLAFCQQVLGLPAINGLETYGATCNRCNEYNPHALAKKDFRCYSCSHWSRSSPSLLSLRPFTTPPVVASSPYRVTTPPTRSRRIGMSSSPNAASSIRATMSVSPISGGPANPRRSSNE